MKNLIDFISQPWLGSLLGILGLCAAVFFYLRSRRLSKLAYQSDGVTILGSSNAAFPEEL
jgi:drug/metabolite transporter (DMT)-like permease